MGASFLPEDEPFLKETLCSLQQLRRCRFVLGLHRWQRLRTTSMAARAARTCDALAGGGQPVPGKHAKFGVGGDGDVLRLLTDSPLI